MPVVLPTDYPVWLLVAVAVGYAWYVRRQPHLAAPWRRVRGARRECRRWWCCSRSSRSGLADSLHFRPQLERRDQQGRPVYGVEVLSLLDVLVMPLRTRTERTYSAPLATRAYARETVELPGGGVAREFPRLRLRRRASRRTKRIASADVAATVLQGVALGFVGWWLAAWLATAALARAARGSAGAMWNAVQRRETEVPWLAVYLTALALALIAVPVALLATKYHVLGTDKVGQDVLYLSLKSIRTGLVIGTLTTLVMLPFAILLGIMAGYFRGWIDDVDPVRLHDDQLDSRRAADRRGGADHAGLHRQEPGALPDRRAARRLPAAAALRDPRADDLDRPRAAAARRGAEALGARVHPGGARVRRAPRRA